MIISNTEPNVRLVIKVDIELQMNMSHLQNNNK